MWVNLWMTGWPFVIRIVLWTQHMCDKKKNILNVFFSRPELYFSLFLPLAHFLPHALGKRGPCVYHVHGGVHGACGASHAPCVPCAWVAPDPGCIHHPRWHHQVWKEEQGLGGDGGDGLDAA